MNGKRIFSWVFGALVLLFSGIVYFQFLYLTGFPDGHRTELERAQLVLFSFFIAVNVALSGFAFRLGWSGSENWDSHFRLTVLTFFCLVLGTLLINFYLTSHLAHGGGG